MIGDAVVGYSEGIGADEDLFVGYCDLAGCPFLAVFCFCFEVFGVLEES